MAPLEYLAGAVFGLLWVTAMLAQRGVLPLAGIAELSLYHLYGTAALAGWLAGNVYVARHRMRGERHKRRLLLLYLFGPPSLIWLLRTLAPIAAQRAAPFVAVYALAVYGIFFLVPVSFRGMQRPPRRPRIGR